MGSARSPATGAGLSVSLWSILCKIKHPDAAKRIQEGQEIWLQHLCHVFSKTDPRVQRSLWYHRRRQGRYHHCQRPAAGLRCHRPVGVGQRDPGDVGRGARTCQLYTTGHTLWGEKFSAQEIDDAFGEFTIDGGMIDANHLKGLM